jgi:hypothetical protein
MAYTLGKETVRVDHVVLWIAGQLCPGASKADQTKMAKRVREAIQYAFSKGQLPGSEGIRATKARLPNYARLPSVF